MPEQDASKEPARQVEKPSKTIEPIGTDEAPVVPSTHPSYEEREKTKEDKPKWTDKAVVFFTLGLVAAAIWQGHIFDKQWQEMHSGGVDTHALADAAKSQADAAKAQADEAKVQVERMSESLTKTDILIKEATAQAIATNHLAVQAQRSADYAQEAIKTSVESERPWVGVSGYHVENFVEGQTAKIFINMVNSGKRPASATTVTATTIVTTLPAFPNFLGMQPSVAFVLPGGSYATNFAYDVPINAFSEWKKKHQIFFIVSEIVYTDVGTNTSYITRFCASYDPTNKEQPFPFCTRYNEAK
jgi:hypothetical protein